MDFSLTTLFVVPVGNTVPVAGSTENLAAGNTGVFLNDYSLATAANVANAEYIYIAQGRKEPYLTGSKRSDKIAKGKVIEFYKSIGAHAPLDQITEVTAFGDSGEEIAVTLRLRSYYIDMAFYNGLTRSVIVKAGDLTVAAEYEAFIDALVAKINAEAMLKQYVVASKSGVGTAAKLVLTGKPVKQDNKVGYQTSLEVNPFHQDRLVFHTYVTKGTATTADFLQTDAIATITLVQRSTFGNKHTAAEIRQMQEYYHSYQNIHKNLFTNPLWNQTYEDFIDDSKIYDLLYIRFRETGGDDSTFVEDSITETVILAIPQGNNADIETILEAYLGAAKESSNDKGAANSFAAGGTTIL